MEAFKPKIFTKGFILVLLISFIFSSWDWTGVYSKFLPNIKVAEAATATLTTTNCYLNDVSDSACQTAVSADGGSTVSIGKGSHIDTAVETIASISSVNSATFYYDHGPSTLSGTWEIYVTDSRDGTTICSTTSAAESSSEITSSFSCNSVTPSQLITGVWIRIYNNDSKSPENVTIDYLRLEVDYEVPTNTLPVASGVSINSGASAVTLTENTTTNVACVGTVTDNDGYADITSVTADFYRTSVGTGGGQDDNNYYQLVGDSQCIPSGGSGNSETYTCTFAVQYFADPTDAGSPNSSDDWTCDMVPTDGVGTGTSASDTVEMNSLLALSVTSSINYGTVTANEDTGASNQTVTITNTGNRDMDPQLSGTDMSDGGNSIGVANQEYSDASFTYGAGTDLSSSPTTFNLSLPQQTSSSITDIIYWGLGVPNGTPSGTYTGTNTFTATAGI